MESVNPNLNWYALLVKNRCEKAVEQALLGKGYTVFLPSYRARRRWSDRVTTVELALFPGYLFCRINLDKRLPVLITPGVLQIVGSGRVPVAVPDSEIEALQRVVSTDGGYEPFPYLAAGQTVRLARGPLAGLEGILVETRRPHRLVVSVTLLHRSVAVEIDSDAIEVPPPARKPPARAYTNAAASFGSTPGDRELHAVNFAGHRSN